MGWMHSPSCRKIIEYSSTGAEPLFNCPVSLCFSCVITKIHLLKRQDPWVIRGINYCYRYYTSFQYFTFYSVFMILVRHNINLNLLSKYPEKLQSWYFNSLFFEFSKKIRILKKKVLSLSLSREGNLKNKKSIFHNCSIILYQETREHQLSVYTIYICIIIRGYTTLHVEPLNEHQSNFFWIIPSSENFDVPDTFERGDSLSTHGWINPAM